MRRLGRNLRQRQQSGQKTLSQKALAILRKNQSTTHVWFPGIGTVNGLTAANYIDSGGITPDALNDVTGLALDAIQNRVSVGNLTFTRIAGDGVLSVNGNQITISNATIATLVLINSDIPYAVSTSFMRVKADFTTATGLAVWQRGSPVDISVSGTPYYWLVPLNNSNLERIDIASGTATFTILEWTYCKGIHLSQPTTANKPVLSKRYNLLTKTEDFSHAIWDKSFVGVAPTGTAGTYRLTVDTSTNVHLLRQAVDASYNLPYESLEVKADGLQFLAMGNSEQSAAFVTFDIVNGTKTLNPTIGNIISLGDGWFRITCKPFGDNSNGAASAWQIRPVSSGTIDVNSTWAGDGTSGILIRKPQYQPVRGNVTTVEHPPYQRVNAATDYDTSVGYNYWRFADASDNFATGAATFGSDMDCFMAVMPDTTAQHVYAANTTSDANKFFGVSNSADAGNTATGYVGAGSLSTYKVNGVDVAGGIGTSRAQLNAALGSGAWKVMEVRNLDLSTWTAMSFGAYSGFAQPHKLGIIIVCPALSEADRAVIRKFCGSFVGVTI